MDRSVLLAIGAVSSAIGIGLYYKTYNKDTNQHRPGQYTECHANGIKVIKDRCDHVGEYKRRYVIGKSEIVETYKNGKLHGLYTEYRDGVMLSQGTYKEGKMIGSYRSWYTNGNPQELKTFNDHEQLDGLYTEYHENGVMRTQRTYRNGKYIGSYKSWYENGNISVDKYYNENEELDGPYTEYHDNGKMYKQVVYINGKKNGICKLWYKSGDIEEEYTCKDDKYEGPSVSYYDAGVKRQQCTYKNGVIDGAFETYHTNGKIDQQGYYVSKKKYLTSQWNSEGKLLVQNTYDSENRFVESVKYKGDDICEVTKFKYGFAVGILKFYKDKKIYACDMYDEHFHGRCVQYLDDKNNYANESRVECTYVCGKLHDEYLEYDAKGAVCKKVIYFNGKIIKIDVYNDESGRDCILENGEITVWKACRAANTNVYVKLLVPEDAKRVTTVDRYKARVTHAKVLEIRDKQGKTYDEAWSCVYTTKFKYVVGETVYADSFCDDASEKCAPGISVHKYIEHCDQWFQSD